MEAEGDCEERGISAFPVHEVHKIALLDMRLGNCDRNGGAFLHQPPPNALFSHHACEFCRRPCPLNSPARVPCCTASACAADAC